MNPVQAMRLIITGCSTDHHPDCLLDTKLFEESMWPIQACSASAAVSWDESVSWDCQVGVEETAEFVGDKRKDILNCNSLGCKDDDEIF
jgi:hypothetical protein